MIWRILFIGAVLAPVLGHSFEKVELRIHHRLIIPGSSNPPFSQRAVIELLPEGLPSYKPSPKFLDEVTTFVKKSRGIPNALYQVALQRPWDETEDDWDLSPVKACYLPEATSDIIYINLSQDNSPYAVDYFVSPTPPTGACSHPTAKLPSLKNTTVSLRLPSQPPKPELRPPPQLTPEGKPIKPPAEQSFFSKYWMYIVGGLLVFTLVAPAPEEAAGDQQGSHN